MDTVCLAGYEASIPYDFLIKCMGKANLFISSINVLPMLQSKNINAVNLRTLMLNSVNKYYGQLWSSCWNSIYTADSWSKLDPRLRSERFTSLTSEWIWDTPLRTDYERRQALVAGQRGGLVADPFHEVAVAGEHERVVVHQCVAETTAQVALGQRLSLIHL